MQGGNPTEQKWSRVGDRSGRSHGVGIQTIYEWRKKYAGMAKSDLAELKSLQEENRRLRRIVANQAMDIEALKELQRGKW